MNGFAPFLAKEIREVGKTWRLWVLPGILLLLGATTPVLAAVTPALLRATAERTPGVVIHFPDPVARDAYLQYMGNLAQIALLVIIVTGAATVAGERRAGTAALLLTKPLSRAAFVVAKALSSIVVVLVATAVGAALCVGVTVLIFGTGDIARFFASVALWLALAAMFSTLMVLLSAATSRQAAAAGAGVAVYVALFILTGFPLIRDYSPAGLMAANDAVLTGKDVALAWPLAVTLLLAALFVGGAVLAFRRKEL